MVYDEFGVIFQRCPATLRAALWREHFGAASEADSHARVGRPRRRPAPQKVAVLVAGSGRFNVEVPAQFADSAISLGLVLAESVSDGKAQLGHCWRAVPAPIEKAIEEPLRRRSDERSDLFAVGLWQLRRLRHDLECSRQTGADLGARRSSYQEARCSLSRL